MDMPITVPRASVTRVGRRPEGPRHGPLPVPRGRHGRRQGGPGRDADRPGADGHDRDHGQLPPARALAPPQAPPGATPTARPRAVLDALVAPRRDRAAGRRRTRDRLIDEASAAALPRFDAQMREYAYQRNQEFVRELGPASRRPRTDGLDPAEAARAAGATTSGRSTRELLDRGRGRLHPAGDRGAARPRRRSSTPTSPRYLARAAAAPRRRRRGAAHPPAAAAITMSRTAAAAADLDAAARARRRSRTS